MIDFTHELTERFLLLTDRSKLLLDRLKAGEFEGAGDKLAAQYIRIDKVK